MVQTTLGSRSSLYFPSSLRSLPTILTQAQQLSPTDYLVWCDTLSGVLGADNLFHGQGISIINGRVQSVEVNAEYPLVTIGPSTGFSLDRVYWNRGHVAGSYEPGTYVVGYDIFAARSDGMMWAIYFGDMGDTWYNYAPLLPFATGHALLERCAEFAFDQSADQGEEKGVQSVQQCVDQDISEEEAPYYYSEEEDQHYSEED